MRKSLEGHFDSWDGTKLFFRVWEPESRATGPANALILMHRGHEHSGRLQETVDELGMGDFWAFAFDARGHGKSPGPRGYAQDFSHLVHDLDSFAKWVTQCHGIPIENVSVIANSVGAVVASTWVHDYAPRIRALVLAAPALRVKLYIPFALPALRLLDKIKHPAFISSYVKSRMLTHDPVEARRYDEDPLVARSIAVNILSGLFDASTRLLDDAAAIVTPVLILSAGRDFVVRLSSQKEFFERLGSRVKEMKVFPKFFHGVFYEKGRKEAFRIAREFVLKAHEKPVETSFLLDAHQIGPSAERASKLREPASLRVAVLYGIQRAFIAAVGRISEGLRTGLETGFDSGLSLDYVYRNEARGITWFGRALDRAYLNAVGWKGIRIRKSHLERALEKKIESLHAAGQPIRIMDIAGGPGRYLLDVLRKHADKDIQVLIRDNVEQNLAWGRSIARSRGLENKIHFIQADAFADCPAARDLKPNLVIVSGLFELIADNVKIAQALSSLARAATPECTVIYTGQPWHPQQEMIARTLTNREGKPWVMRLRSQAELDEIFRAQGFDKSAMEIDTYGIFTVSTSERHGLPKPESAIIRRPESPSRSVENSYCQT